MNCPNCSYEPDINEFDWVSGPGRFFELGIEAKQEPNQKEHNYQPIREPIYGCPHCGIMFMNKGFVK